MPAHNSVFIVFGLMTHLEFLTLFISFTIVGQENVSTSQTQQISKTLWTIGLTYVNIEQQ